MCGIFGIAGHPEAVGMTYLGLYAQQHRGQEGCGIVSSDGGRLHAYRAMGYVRDVFSEERLRGLRGQVAIGHTRYSTAGGSVACNIQPLVAGCGYGPTAIGHNGNLTNFLTLRKELEAGGAIFQSSSDTEVILHLIAQPKAPNILEALVEALKQIQGAYSLVLLNGSTLIGARDPYGFRPLCLGLLNGSYVLASETCAFDLVGAKYVREIEPGEIVQIQGSNIVSTRVLEAPRLARCIFEEVYFARPDSLVFGRTGQVSREMFGRILAQESPVEADIVVPVPDSGVPAALGFSRESGIPFALALIRNHYVGRTFIEPEAGIRNFGVKVKLNPVRELLAGKRVVLVDDSIVRATTIPKIVRMVRDAGATEVHVRISYPPFRFSCEFGIDTPTQKELIASSKSVEEIRKHINADSLAFLSADGLFRDRKQQEFCTRCCTGEYPILSE